MTDINSLIRLNVEIEGLLRVLADRPAPEARTLLADKFSQYSAMIGQYLGETEQPAPSAPTPEPTAAPEPAPEPETPVAMPDPEPEPVCQAAPEPVAQPAPAQTAGENQKLLRAFTLNDKFRFRRELFNGDIEDFADTLALLAQMPSYAEAVDYLTNDLLWDTRNPAVEEFFAILKDNMPA